MIFCLPSGHIGIVVHFGDLGVNSAEIDFFQKIAEHIYQIYGVLAWGFDGQKVQKGYK